MSSRQRRERSRSPIRTREDIVRERRELREKERREQEKEENELFPKIDYNPKKRENSQKSETNKKEESNGFGGDAPDHLKSDEFKHEFGKSGALADDEDNKKKEPKEQSNLGLSGALTEDQNTYKGVVIKYAEPEDSQKPKKKWRLYPFKGKEALKTLHIHRQSAFLIGKLRGIVDIPVDHPSCSRQHAVIQYRRVKYTRKDGSSGQTVKPYVIDLESGNGTFLNNKKLEPRRYYELKEQDVLKFGFSTRDYVMLLDNSETEGVDAENIEERTNQEMMDEFLDENIKKFAFRKK